MARAERSLAPHRPGMRPRQPCVDPALVEEDQTLGVDPGQLGAPCRPLLSEVGAVLLLGPEGFLRTRPSRLSARHKVEPLARAPVRSASRSAYSASVEAFASATRVRRTSRILPSSRRGGPPRAGLAVRRPRRAPRRGLGRPPPLGPALLLPAVERRPADPKQNRDPSAAQPAALASEQRPLPQVGRVGSWHARSPLPNQLNRPNQIGLPSDPQPALARAEVA